MQLFFGLLFAAMASAQLVNDCISMRNKHLNVAVSHLPPTIVVKRDAKGDAIGFEGRAIEQLEIMGQRLNASFTMYPSPGNIAGVKANGSWNGVIGELVKHRADLGLYAFSISLERYEAIDFAGTMVGDGASMLVKYPETGFSFWTVYKPFDSEVWIFWIISFLVVSLASWLLIRFRVKFNSSGDGRFNTVGDMFIYLFGTFTAQGGYYRSGHKSLGILAAMWCLVSFVFVNAYSSVLISYLSVRYQTPVINTIADLAANSDYQVTTLKGSIYEMDLLNATSGNFKILGDRLRKCPSCRTSTFEEVARLVLSGKYVGILPPSSNINLVVQDYAKTGKCRLTLANEHYGWKAMYWGVPKHSPYIEDLNRESLWTVDLGFYKRWKSLYKFAPQCMLSFNGRGVSAETVKTSRLKLEQFYGVFLLLFIGSFLALLAFIYENISIRKHQA